MKTIKKYPLLIIGTGPAGLTASIYASRYGINHMIIGEAMGGLVFESHKICNFPGEQDISGIELINKIQKHAESLGHSLLIDKIVNISQKKKVFEIITQNKKVFLSDTILLAAGTKHRRLNLPDENKFIGHGISYCATCDAMFYKDKIVAVVGGSDSANTASLYLSQIAKKVYQIYRKDKLRGITAWIDQIKNNKKIEIIYNQEIIGLRGKEKLEKIILNNSYQGKKEIAINGLFIEIGAIPDKTLIQEALLKTDKNGYIKVTPDQKTSRNEIWAAGDITTASNNFHQIITACSEGAIAVESIFNFLQQNK